MTFAELQNLAAAHIIWKVRLLRHIEGSSDEHLEVAAVRQDDGCDLGKWIHGEGSKHIATKAYKDLVKVHTEFHVMASEVLKKAEDGDTAGAKAILNGALDTKSIRIVNSIMALKDVIEGEFPSG